MSGSHLTSSESEALLPTAQEDSKLLSPSSMAPTPKDRLSLWFIIVGAILFVPSAWYMALHRGFGAGWFVPHPPLLSLAVIFFIAALVPLQPPTPPPQVREARTQTHQYITGSASAAMVVGVACMWMNKHVHSASHFTTWHGTFGLITVCWVGLQGLLGGLSFWSGGKAFGGGAKAKKVYKYHRLSGYGLITLALITAHMGGAQSTWSFTQPAFPRIIGFWIGLPLIWLGPVMRIRTSKMQFMS